MNRYYCKWHCKIRKKVTQTPVCSSHLIETRMIPKRERKTRTKSRRNPIHQSPIVQSYPPRKDYWKKKKTRAPEEAAIEENLTMPKEKSNR
jgi:hypothetical protein